MFYSFLKMALRRETWNLMIWTPILWLSLDWAVEFSTTFVLSVFFISYRLSQNSRQLENDFSYALIYIVFGLYRLSRWSDIDFDGKKLVGSGVSQNLCISCLSLSLTILSRNGHQFAITDFFFKLLSVGCCHTIGKHPSDPKTSPSKALDPDAVCARSV